MPNAKPVRKALRVEIHKVEDPNGRLLVTQRAAHMRTFPRCWVFPGGGVDEGELLFLGLLRNTNTSNACVRVCVQVYTYIHITYIHTSMHAKH